MSDAYAGRAIVKFDGDYSNLQSGLASALGPGRMGATGRVAGVALGGAIALAVGGIVGGKMLYDLGDQVDAGFDTIRAGTGKTGDPLKSLQDSLKNVVKSIPTDFETAGGAVAALNQRLDIMGKPLEKRAKQMLELSRITGTDAQDNIVKITRLWGDWSVKTNQQVPSLDKLFRLSQSTGSGIGDLADYMVQFGSPLRQLGFDFDTSAAMFAKFDKEGVNLQTAMPGLRMALRNFAKDGKEPAGALQETIDKIKSAKSSAEANTIAFEIFGTRAGPDLAAAIREGRFEFDGLIGRMNNGKDTIRGAAEDTNDFGENTQIFFNKLKVALEPLASAVYDELGKISGVIAKWDLQGAIRDVRRFVRTNEDFKDSLDAMKVALKVLGAIFRVVFETMRDQVKAAVGFATGVFQTFRGVIKVVSGVLTGDFRKAWDGVKDIFRGSVKIVLAVIKAMTAPLRSLFRGISRGMGDIFRGAWEKVKDIFTGGANVVIDVVNKIIEAINLIPGVNIDTVDNIGGSGDRKGIPGVSEGNLGRQSGGIVPGNSEGDSWRKDLPEGSYVLNKKATRAYGLHRSRGGNVRTILEPGERYFLPDEVRKIGLGNLEKMNHGVPRFGHQNGGLVRLAGGGLAGLALDVAGAVAGRGADFFLDKLPDPNIPQPFTPAGPWMIDKAEEFIKDKVKDMMSFTGPASAAGAGTMRSYPGLSGDTDFAPSLGNALSAMATALGINIRVNEGFRTFAEQTALWNANPNPMMVARPGTSNHEDGLAADIYPERPAYGGKEGQFGLTFPMSWEAWHIERAQLGGLIQHLMRGGEAEHQVVREVGAHLLGRGFDFRATSGILGNAWREGLWKPSQMEFTGLSNGGLYGFTTPPVSLEDLKAWAGSKGLRWDDGVVQTRFMLSHGQPTGMAIRGAMNSLDSIPKAAEYFMTNWERPAPETNGLSERIGAGYDAAKILQAAGITKAGDTSGGMSDAQRDAMASKSRVKTREDLLDKLYKDTKQAKTLPGERSSLWKLIGAYAKFGDYDKGEKGTVLEKVRAAASATDPSRGIEILKGLSGFLRRKVEVIGDEDGDEKFSKLVDKVKDKAQERGSKKRQRITNRITRTGLEYDLKKPLAENLRVLEAYDEYVNIDETNAALESGPGGSDMTDAEARNIVDLYLGVQMNQGKRKSMLTEAIADMSMKRDKFAGMVEITKSDPRLKWRLPAYKDGLANSKTSLSELTSSMTDLVGITGGGGLMFDTQTRLKELGVTKTYEQMAKDQFASGISVSDLLQIVGAAKYNVFGRMPQFHTGGDVEGSSHEEIMALVKGKEGVFTPPQMGQVASALRGPATVQVIVNGDIVSDDPDPVEVVIGDQRFKAEVRKEISSSNRNRDHELRAGVK